MTEQTIGQAHGSRVSRQAQARRQAAAVRARRAHERALAAQERARALRAGLDRGEPATAASGSAYVHRAAEPARQPLIDLDEVPSATALAHRDAAALHGAVARRAREGLLDGAAAQRPDVEVRVQAQLAR